MKTNYYFLVLIALVISITINVYHFSNDVEYQIELINQTDVKLMNSIGETIKITTLDSIPYYIEKDNL
jgi:hypothetical protein